MHQLDVTEHPSTKALHGVHDSWPQARGREELGVLAFAPLTW